MNRCGVPGCTAPAAFEVIPGLDEDDGTVSACVDHVDEVRSSYHHAEVQPVEPCDTCTPAFRGILISDNTSSVGPGVVSVERCDACMVYEGDLDAAWALANVAGGRVYFWQSDGAGDHHEFGAEPDWQRREFDGVYSDDDCIAFGTDAWIEGIDLSVITRAAGEQEYRVTWEIDISASSPLEAAREAFGHMQRPGTTATVFEVTGPDGTYDIDLGKGDA